MKVKSGLKLREVGNMYMIVDANSSQVNLTNVFSLNAIAADVWRYVGDKEFTLQHIVSYICEEYAVDQDTANKDAMKLIEEWISYGLITED